MIFAGLHYYWAVGGAIGLSVSSGPDLATRRPIWFVVLGLWGVGTLCVVGAALGVALARSQPRNAVLRRTIGGLGWLVAIVLLVRGVLVEVLLLTNMTHLDASVGPSQRFWTHVLWNPWFVAGGISFALAAANFRASIRTPLGTVADDATRRASSQREGAPILRTAEQGRRIWVRRP